ncbi:hypothetical protein [Ilumatobacter nonamiensis]|uniref:hypothetical protein n=1 Tax=Ilumatobacter nonamiensis TaxID=467093 RepID=UPI00034D6F33|nr:hypothetical protein [Ilumatobacter nonamiensis]
MSILPYALRPRAVIRKTAVKRGVDGGSVMWRALALYFVGGPTLVRTNAIRRGFLSGNRTWQVVGVALILSQDLRGMFRKKPEPIGRFRVKSNDFIRVTNIKPQSRRQLKRAGTNKKAKRASVIAEAVAAAQAKHPDARIVVKTK